MSGFLDRIKDVSKDALGTFVEFEEEGQQPVQGRPAPPAGASPAAGSPAPPPLPPAAAPVAAGAGVPDPEFVQQLHSAVGASKLGAYAQFRTLYSALGAVPDEAQRTQLALSAAQASHGVSAEHVAEAVEDRLRILGGEREAFERAVADEVQQTIGGSEARLQETRAEIQRREEEIRAMQARCAEMEQGMADARAAIDANSARFAASYAAVEAELAAERARIAPFLSTPRL
ncbi:MAG: hypothetical protein ABW277_26330 [Longimicrobiaceae bacterium]